MISNSYVRFYNKQNVQTSLLHNAIVSAKIKFHEKTIKQSLKPLSDLLYREDFGRPVLESMCSHHRQVMKV